MQNSWYFNENGKDYFICKCGHNDVLEEQIEENEYEFNGKFNREEIDFRTIPNLYYRDNTCSLCSNEHYLDRDALIFQDRTLYWSKIEWEHDEIADENFWRVFSFISIPKLFNDNIIFEKLELSSYTVSKSSKHCYVEHQKNLSKKQMLVDGVYRRIFKIIKSEMSEKLVQLINSNPSKSLAWLEPKEEKLENLLFFLENATIRFRDILYWKRRDYFLEECNRLQYLEPSLSYILNNRSEKSLRRTQFISYEKMMLIGGYNPMVDYIFSRTIKDINHLRTAIVTK